MAEFGRSGFTVRPLASALRKKDGLELWVGPGLVSTHHCLAPVEGETSGVALHLSGREEPFAMIGKGAGGIPTARSVVRDLYELARKARHRVVEVPTYHEGDPLETIPREEYCYRWWVRFKVSNEPGVFGKITGVLGDNQISIREAMQRGEDCEVTENCARIHLTTEETNWGKLAEALESLKECSFIVSALALPILR